MPHPFFEDIDKADRKKGHGTLQFRLTGGTPERKGSDMFKDYGGAVGYDLKASGDCGPRTKHRPETGGRLCRP
jgi:hypothetical protein